MTPKDKAIEIINKMQVIHYVKLGGKNSKSKGLPVSMYKSQTYECAINSIDEVLTALSEWKNTYMGKKQIDFYKQVKYEILSLDDA